MPKEHSGGVTYSPVASDEIETTNVPTGSESSEQIEWLSTQEAARRLGITPRTLYRFIDHGDLPAYRFGRVIRLQAREVDMFIQNSRIKPGELEHLYPEPVSREEEL